MMMPASTAELLQSALGGHTNNTYKPNEIKINNLLSGTLENLRVSIQPDKKNPETKVCLEIVPVDGSNMPVSRIKMTADKGNYSKIYYYEVQNMKSGLPVLAREADSFDVNDFPHNITTIQYDQNGNAQKEEEYKIIDAKINTDIPEAVFDMNQIGKYND